MSTNHKLEQQFYQDRYKCQLQMEQATSASAPTNVNVNTVHFGSGIDWGAIAAANAQNNAMEVHAQEQVGLFKSCMLAAGYTFGPPPADYVPPDAQQAAADRSTSTKPANPSFGG